MYIASPQSPLPTREEKFPYIISPNLPVPQDLNFSNLKRDITPPLEGKEIKKRKFEDRTFEQDAPQLNFSETVQAPSRTPRIPPPTPQKKRTNPNQRVCSFEKLFKQVSEQRLLNIYGKEATLAPFKAGTFMQAYTLTANAAILPHAENDQLLVKLYHGRITNFNPKLPIYLSNSLNSYSQMLKLELPVSKIYNEETARTDHFLLVEKLPHQIDIKNESHLKQIRHFLEVSFKEKEAIDLAYNNLCIRNENDKNIVALIDFNERPLDFAREDKVSIFVIQYLKSWVKAISDEHIKFSKEEQRAAVPAENNDNPLNINVNSENRFRNEFSQLADSETVMASSGTAEQRELSLEFLTKLTEGIEGFNQKWNSEAIDGQLPLIKSLKAPTI